VHRRSRAVTVGAVAQMQVRCRECNRRLGDFVNELEAGQVILELKCPNWEPGQFPAFPAFSANHTDRQAHGGDYGGKGHHFPTVSATFPAFRDQATNGRKATPPLGGFATFQSFCPWRPPGMPGVAHCPGQPSRTAHPVGHPRDGSRVVLTLGRTHRNSR
jgi:hypothetical protein